MSLFDKKKTATIKTSKVVAESLGKVKKEKTVKEEKSMKDLYDSTDTSNNKQKKVSDKKVFKYEQAYNVLRKPLVTEKVTNLGVYNKYVFVVADNTNKVEVAKAVNQIYGVKPIKVNMIKMIGKATRSGKVAGKRKNWKKAIVTLSKGETIKIYEGV
ncbi:MAG: 50S ribosomal protein L23 [bacterium]|nr:50S ribosomal protein L23 [bacterium]